MAQDVILKMCGIGKVFPGSIALDNVDLELKSGEIHGIVGGNGAGKSTLMKVLSGIYQPDSGMILFHGKETKFSGSKDAMEKGIGIVHQELVNCPHLSVAENIFMGHIDSRKGRFLSYRQIEQEAETLLGRFDARINPPISFSLRCGEILGFSGLVGAGRTELFQAICGLQRKEQGEVFLHGEKLECRQYGQAVASGVVYLSEDRKSEGLFLEMPIKKNISVLCLDAITPNKLLIKDKMEYSQGEKYIAERNIKCKGPDQLVGTLSGGDQQKVLLGKLLSVSPRLVILDESTRGVDIGAKLEIYQILRALAEKGVGVIIISSDLPEIVGVCDRVAVMYEGELRDIAQGDDINETHIMRISSGILKQREVC